MKLEMKREMKIESCDTNPEKILHMWMDEEKTRGTAKSHLHSSSDGIKFPPPPLPLLRIFIFLFFDLLFPVVYHDRLTRTDNQIHANTIPSQ